MRGDFSQQPGNEKKNPLISWALSLNVWMMRLLRVIENFQILVENVAENLLQHITQGRETPSGQSPANVVAPLCCCCWFCAVHYRATIASATAARRSPPHRCRTRAAACRLPRRKLRSAAPKAALLALSFTWLRHFSRQPEFELKRGIDIYILNFKLCQKVMCNSIEKSWQLSKPSDHDNAWNLPKKLTIEYKSSKNGFGTDFGLDHFGTFDCQQSR